MASAWRGTAPRWCLVLAGPASQAAQLPPNPPGWAPGQQVHFDSSALQGWDTALAAALWQRLVDWQTAGVAADIRGLPAGLQDLLGLAQTQAVAPTARPASATPTEAEGRLLPFIGAVVLASADWLAGRAGPRGSGLLRQLDEAGPRTAPVSLLACALVGLMLAYMGGAQLQRIGAQNFLADVVTVGMVRELGGLMTAIILAGRVASAYAAQLATMKAGEEIDALRALGLDPVAHLVLPRVLALLLLAPLLMALGAGAGVLAGWPAATLAYGVGSAEYWQQSQQSLTPTHLWIGLCKGLIYAVLVALAGCRAGLAAGRSAEAVGQATTRAVVDALVWVVAAASLTTVVFTAMGY
jgi:phospholipid/cholesterol/gamma-HCH transport system permease protein